MLGWYGLYGPRCPLSTKRPINLISLSPPSATYMHQWIGSALVQIMACRLFGAKSLSKPMLAYCQLDLWEQISVKFKSEFYYIHSQKCIWNCRLPTWQPFCPRGDESTTTLISHEQHKQRVLMHGHQGWNVRHGLCHIYMIYVYIWVVHSFCLFCCLFIIVTTQFVALYEPCKPKPKPKPSTYDTRTTTPWQRSKFRYLDRSQSNKYAINMQIQTISVSK